MTSISHHPNLPVDATPRPRSGAERPVSTLQPFAPGDVFVGATLLNSATDDHAGLGRILQFDADLNEKGVLWVEGTTHLVYGLTFAPDGTLWAQDPWAWTTVRVDPSGRQLQNLQFDMRAFSKVHFMADGTLLFTENLDGDYQPRAAHDPAPPAARPPHPPGRRGPVALHHRRRAGRDLRAGSPRRHERQHGRHPLGAVAGPDAGSSTSPRPDPA